MKKYKVIEPDEMQNLPAGIFGFYRYIWKRLIPSSVYLVRRIYPTQNIDTKKPEYFVFVYVWGDCYFFEYEVPDNPTEEKAEEIVTDIKSYLK